MSNSTCQTDGFKVISTVEPILQKTWEYAGSVLIETGLWGAYVILFSFAVYIQCTKGFKSNRNRLVMFIVTCVLFINCTVLWIIDLTSLQLYGKALMQRLGSRDLNLSSSKLDSESKVSNLEEITSRLKPWGIVQEILFLINVSSCVAE
ncbi:hypothetical protein VKT23_000201 [Stygiomarasmius scandens]|uniref:Uncharacterized protein n=1 Tax=Marasmiellus scandens TaxID=2682957 RepID=A0ABR1K7C5_9AGAR